MGKRKNQQALFPCAEKGYYSLHKGWQELSGWENTDLGELFSLLPVAIAEQPGDSGQYQALITGAEENAEECLQEKRWRSKATIKQRGKLNSSKDMDTRAEVST